MICTLCEIEKPRTEFYRNGAGTTSRCKQCICIQNAPDKKGFLELIRIKHDADNLWIDEYSNYSPGVPPAVGDWDAFEVWRPIHPYDAQYEVSNRGRVRSYWEHRRGNYFKRPVPIVLEQCLRTNYPSVSLVDWATGQKDTHGIHQLVCAAFRGPRPSRKHVVGHRDGNPRNNNLSNLGWITYKQNELDKLRHGTKMIGARNHASKLSDVEVRQIREAFKLDESREAICKRFGISLTHGYSIAAKRSRKYV
jgi:hypothetical protein